MSYFQSDDVSSFNDGNSIDYNLTLREDSHIISFPGRSSVLWYGEAVSDKPAENLEPLKILPRMFLNSRNMKALLRQMCSVEMTNALNVVTVMHSSCLGQSHEEREKYFFAIIDPKNSPASNCQLTIPLESNSELNSFDSHSTKSLIRNIIKALRSGPEFTLKSCYRIMAVGQSSRGFNDSNREDMHGFIKLQAICPDVWFQVYPIRPVQWLLTPLLNDLTREAARGLSPTMGYLTLNQTRKLVVLKETDPAVPRTPMVGVWVRVDQATDAMSLPHHPFCWGACIRYLTFEGIQDRRFKENSETFLMVVIVPGRHIEYFEVTRQIPIQHQGDPVFVSPGLYLSLREQDFLAADLDVSLSCRQSDAEERCVLGEFRPPLSGIPAKSHRPPRVEASVDSLPPPQRAHTQRHSSAAHKAVSSSLSFLASSAPAVDAEITPAPRNIAPLPSSAERPIRIPTAKDACIADQQREISRLQKENEDLLRRLSIAEQRLASAVQAGRPTAEPLTASPPVALPGAAGTEAEPVSLLTATTAPAAPILPRSTSPPPAVPAAVQSVPLVVASSFENSFKAAVPSVNMSVRSLAGGRYASNPSVKVTAPSDDLDSFASALMEVKATQQQLLQKSSVPGPGLTTTAPARRLQETESILRIHDMYKNR